MLTAIMMAVCAAWAQERVWINYDNFDGSFLDEEKWEIGETIVGGHLVSEGWLIMIPGFVGNGDLPPLTQGFLSIMTKSERCWGIEFDLIINEVEGMEGTGSGEMRLFSYSPTNPPANGTPETQYVDFMHSELLNYGTYRKDDSLLSETVFEQLLTPPERFNFGVVRHFKFWIDEANFCHMQVDADERVSSDLTGFTTPMAWRIQLYTVYSCKNEKIANVKVLIDQPNIVLDTDEIVVDENGNATFSVNIDKIPYADMSVSISLSGDSTVSLDKPTLTFTKDNWDIPQEVNVSAGDDFDGTGGAANIDLSMSDSLTGTLMDEKSVAVEVVDDEVWVNITCGPNGTVRPASGLFQQGIIYTIIGNHSTEYELDQITGDLDKIISIDNDSENVFIQFRTYTTASFHITFKENHDIPVSLRPPPSSSSSSSGCMMSQGNVGSTLLILMFLVGAISMKSHCWIKKC
jgi:hypothetical protein